MPPNKTLSTSRLAIAAEVKLNAATEQIKTEKNRLEKELEKLAKEQGFTQTGNRFELPESNKSTGSGRTFKINKIKKAGINAQKTLTTLRSKKTKLLLEYANALSAQGFLEPKKKMSKKGKINFRRRSSRKK
jgi:hypothetical protein